jgi:hypothetical protein
MLIYDPALDPYHTAVRILAIAFASNASESALTVDAARISDYFLAYPYKMATFKFPAEFKTIRAAVKETENPYRQANGNRAVFERMRPVFFAAISGLVAAGIVDADGIKRGILALTDKEVPAELEAAAQRFQARQTTVGKFLLTDFLAIPSSGPNGLKHRSNLLEHRYDIV